MKNTRMCPKCQSSDIVRIDGNTGAYGSGNNILLGGTIFSAVKVTGISVVAVDSQKSGLTGAILIP